ncbi:MAG: TonB family protein [Thermoanaerobaculaceae bacterium]|nr:TonB family protein [Thermoanaerobaculaceae bacterium]MDI9621185.1 TonB family protein [Acidobacteriota bacterium]NLH09738.1 TonB family protein [Holophagae bacterium]HPW56631.1 TonB family protein [Thermoanaerobaculaceae bacterium]
MADSYTTFGNFLLLKERARGGVGSLWRAGEMERTGFKRIVWLRRLDQIGLDRNLMSADFAAANQIAQTLKASSIVRNASVGREKGVPYLAWDYVPSQPLDQLLERVAHEQFPIAIDNALLIAEKITAALASALSVEVGGEPLHHGFLLPHMVMIGNDGEAMAGGFGLAKGFLANLAKVPALKDAAAPYLAPEVLGGQPASRRTDVYSVGAILFQLLTGSPLPADPTVRAAALTAPQLAFEEGAVPADVMAILRKTLATRPEERFGSAAELKRELEKLLYGGAYSPTTFNLALFMDRLYRNDIEQEDRELQKERGLDVAAYYQPPKPAASETPAPVVVEQPASSRTGLYVAIGAVAVLAVVVGILLLRPTPQAGIDSESLRNEVKRQLDAYNQQIEVLRREAEAERIKAAELQQQLEDSRKGAGPRKLTAEEQAKIEADIRAREEADRQRRERLAAIEAQAKQLEAKVAAPVVVPTSPPVVPTPIPQPTAAPVATLPAAVPTTAPPTAPPATQAPAAVAPTVAPVPAAPGIGLGDGLKENDLVDPTLVDVPPQILQDAKPSYSRVFLMSRQSLQGLVILKALVNAKGLVEDVQVLRPFPVPKLGVDEACAEAARQYRFKAATKGGIKVKTWATITMQVSNKR